MTESERRTGTSKSGWCIERDHARCIFAGCNCTCHGGGG